MKNFIKNTLQSQKVFYRYFRRKGLKRFLKENILETQGSNRTKALSVALGVFVGFTPLWGFHTVIVLFLAAYFRLNKMISYMCTHISAPPLIPFIIAGCMYIGGLITGNKVHFLKSDLNMDFVKENLLQYLIGSLFLSIVLSAVFGFITYFILEKISPNRHK